MLGEYFSYTLVNKERNNSIQTDLYSFKCNYNQAYIIEVEHHDDSIFIIKFFKKNHSDSKYRYCLLNKKSFLRKHKTNGAKNFLMVLNTIIKIILDTYTSNKKASFGFIGAPTKKELEYGDVNDDGTVANSKRYNVYGIYVKRYFSPDDFEHIELETSSGYLIKSRKNLDLTTPKIEGFFENYIQNYC